MKTDEEVKALFLDYMADAFLIEKDVIDLSKRFREDYAANSMKFFPLLGGLEDDLGIEISLRDFQNDCHTVQQGLDYVTALYHRKNGQ